MLGPPSPASCVRRDGLPTGDGTVRSQNQGYCDANGDTGTGISGSHSDGDSERNVYRNVLAHVELTPEGVVHNYVLSSQISI